MDTVATMDTVDTMATHEANKGDEDSLEHFQIENALLTQARQSPRSGVDFGENDVFPQNDALKHSVFQKQNALVVSIVKALGDERCITVIGMAGAGKSTVGRKIAEALGWAHVDSDHLIEATYGVRLQHVTDVLDKDAFLDVEAQVLCAVRMQRTVLSTGGSVVYRPETMQYLTTLGPIVHLDVPLDIILERIARKPDRGMAIAPGQTLEDLFLERERLYRHWATCSVPVDDQPVELSVDAVLHALAESCQTFADAPGVLEGHAFPC